MSNASGVSRMPAVVHPLAHQMMEQDKAYPDKNGNRKQRRAWKKKYGTDKDED